MRRPRKSDQAFRSIGEVAELVGVAPHVLRYWESQFPLFRPVKRRDGRRYYRPEDVHLALGICAVLREDGVSIRDAKAQMRTDRGAATRARGVTRLAQGQSPAPDATASSPTTPAQQSTASSGSAAATQAKQTALPKHKETSATPSNKSENTAPESQAPAPRSAPRAPISNAPPPASKTRARPASMADTLPLFPDLEPPRPDPNPDWLARLQAISTALRQRDPKARISPRLSEVAQEVCAIAARNG